MKTARALRLSAAWPGAVAMFICSAGGADFTAKVVDGLGRPVPQAAFQIYRLKPEATTNARVTLFNAVSDTGGLIKGRYDDKAVPAGELVWIELGRKGYAGYSSTGLEKQYVLNREFHAEDVAPMAALTGAAQTNALRELLAGEFVSAKESLPELLFVNERRLHTALRALSRDPKVGVRACEILAFIGAPEDLRAIVQSPPPADPEQADFGNRWAGAVAAAMLEPSGESDWAFLNKCVTNEFNDFKVFAAGVRSLKLIATPRCERMLLEASTSDNAQTGLLKPALNYIRSRPPQLANRDLDAAAKRVAGVLGVGDWKGNQAARFNADKDKALIDCEYITGRDLVVYTTTFHKVGEYWRLRGARETYRTRLPNPPPSARPAPPAPPVPPAQPPR